MISILRDSCGNIEQVITDLVPLTRDQMKRIENRNDWKSFEQATFVAAELTAYMRAEYIPVDNGPGHYPRYDVVRVPCVGEEVSKYFNGDAYPCGFIVKANSGKSGQFKIIETSTGKKFYRRRLTGSWVHDQCWSLILGHHNDRNPSF